MKLIIAGAVVAAAAAALAAPAFAHPRYVCAESGSRRSQDAVIGTVAGALIGSNVAPTGKRTEGTLIGAAAGAVIGAKVGENQTRTRCRYVGGYDGPRYYERHDNGRHRGWYKHRD